jgi:hypothetical protein
VRERQRGREAEAARRDRVVQQADHLLELLGRRFTVGRAGAHHVAAQGAVTDQEADVQPDVAVERAEVVGERAPTPRHTGLERGQRHAFDLRHHAAQVVGVFGRERREREAAVAGDDARDAVQIRRPRGRVPEQLRVVVRVRVDEAGCNDESVRVDRDRGVLGDRADRHDAAVADPDVGPTGRRAGPVYEHPASDQRVEHGRLPAVRSERKK